MGFSGVAYAAHQMILIRPRPVTNGIRERNKVKNREINREGERERERGGRGERRGEKGGTREREKERKGRRKRGIESIDIIAADEIISGY